MDFKTIMIIGGIIIGFLILIFGFLVLKKMKEEDKAEVKKDDSIKGNSIGTNEPVIMENSNENVIGIEPEANASELLKDESSNTMKESTDDDVSQVLNDEVQLDNSSLDSEIVSKPSVETEEDFLNKEPQVEETITPEKPKPVVLDKVDNLSNDSTEVNDSVNTEVVNDAAELTVNKESVSVDNEPKDPVEDNSSSTDSATESSDDVEKLM